MTTFKQNQFGFSVGGPVWIPKLYNGKNRTFFYGAFQKFLYRRPSNSFFRVPTEANYNGDLSDIPTPIYNPFTPGRIRPIRATLFEIHFRTIRFRLVC